MPLEVNPNTVAGSVTFLNEVFASHDARTAKILHPSNWRQFVNERSHLTSANFLQDSLESSLLVTDIDSVIERVSKTPRRRQALELRFGFDGTPRSLTELGQALGGVTSAGIRLLNETRYTLYRHPSIIPRLEETYFPGFIPSNIHY